MARLYRPHIPLKVQCEAALRQLGENADLHFVAAKMIGWTMRETRDALRERIARVFGCEVKDLRLDHDPPLALRAQERRGLGRKTYYTPDANDPEHLVYRPHGAQFEGSHDVKTRIRGDHGQFSDIALIKRQRRRERPPKPKKKIESRGFQKGPKRPWGKRGFK